MTRAVAVGINRAVLESRIGSAFWKFVVVPWVIGIHVMIGEILPQILHFYFVFCACDFLPLPTSATRQTSVQSSWLMSAEC